MHGTGVLFTVELTSTPLYKLIWDAISPRVNSSYTLFLFEYPRVEKSADKLSTAD